MNHKAYQSIKHSGIPWVDSIPDHWDVLPLLRVGRERDESNVGMLESNLLSLSYGRIVQKDIESNEGLLPESFETYQIVHPGDIVLRLTDLQNDKRSLRSAIVKQRGIVTSAYCAICPEQIDATFIAYLFRSYDLTKVFYSMGGGLRQSLKYADLKRLPIIVPNISEQKIIAAFLDNEAVKIDTLISEQKRLSELLQEKRQAVISHAVTKGLDPTVPMKDSGVKWIGQMPHHWEISQSRRMFRERNEKAKPEERQLTASQKYGIIFQSDFMALENQKVVLVIHGADILKHVEPNDFVISMRSFQGGLEWSGNIGSISSAYVMLIPGEQVFSSFFKHLFKSKSYIQALQSTSNLVRDGQAMRYGNFVQVALPVVPFEEQKLIAKYLDKELAKFDELIEESSSVIGILQERRAALISAAVTGKIDVRNWQAKKQKEEVPA